MWPAIMTFLLFLLWAFSGPMIIKAAPTGPLDRLGIEADSELHGFFGPLEPVFDTSLNLERTDRVPNSHLRATHSSADLPSSSRTQRYHPYPHHHEPAGVVDSATRSSAPPSQLFQTNPLNQQPDPSAWNEHVNVEEDRQFWAALQQQFEGHEAQQHPANVLPQRQVPIQDNALHPSSIGYGAAGALSTEHYASVRHSNMDPQLEYAAFAPSHYSSPQGIPFQPFQAMQRNLEHPMLTHAPVQERGPPAPVDPTALRLGRDEEAAAAARAADDVRFVPPPNFAYRLSDTDYIKGLVKTWKRAKPYDKFTDYPIDEDVRNDFQDKASELWNGRVTKLKRVRHGDTEYYLTMFENSPWNIHYYKTGNKRSPTAMLVWNIPRDSPDTMLFLGSWPITKTKWDMLQAGWLNEIDFVTEYHPPRDKGAPFNKVITGESSKRS